MNRRNYEYGPKLRVTPTYSQWHTHTGFALCGPAERQSQNLCPNQHPLSLKPRLVRHPLVKESSLEPGLGPTKSHMRWNESHVRWSSVPRSHT